EFAVAGVGEGLDLDLYTDLLTRVQDRIGDDVAELRPVGGDHEWPGRCAGLLHEVARGVEVVLRRRGRRTPGVGCCLLEGLLSVSPSPRTDRGAPRVTDPLIPGLDDPLTVDGQGQRLPDARIQLAAAFGRNQLLRTGARSVVDLQPVDI